jgi:hypothetical protein
LVVVLHGGNSHKVDNCKDYIAYSITSLTQYISNLHKVSNY